MQSVSATQQVNFISYLQRLLVEGDFVATYKFALLHALADICIEKTDPADNIITLEQLTEKFIELYWQHSLPFTATQNSPFLLKQNAGKQAALITQLSNYRHQGIRSITRLKAHKDWNKLLSKTKQTIKAGPLWRLQKLSGVDQCFFYPHDANKNHIVLNEGIAYCFRRFYDLVVSLARSHWVEKIRTITDNHQVIGGQGELTSFLFGSGRNAITQAKPFLHDLQNGQCFYCQKSLQEKGAEVDHFIPWARYPTDLGHNFVLAHAKCNNSKRDYLAIPEYRDRWFEQNIVQNKNEITNELGSYFVCEAPRSEAVTTWAYQLAVDNNATFWPLADVAVKPQQIFTC